MKKASVISRLAFALMAAVPALTVALPEDRDLPINVEADEAHLDEQKGLGIYTGSVILTQGTIRVSADKLTIYMKNDEVFKITAQSGAKAEPAQYSEVPRTDEARVHANARTITYHNKERRIELVGDAKLVQENDLFTGAEIDYDIGREVITGQSGDASERVRGVFNVNRTE